MVNDGTNNSAPQEQVVKNVTEGKENVTDVSRETNVQQSETKESSPEKTFTRDELAKITDRTKRETEDKVRREVLAEMQKKALEEAARYQSQVPQGTQAVTPQAPAQGQYLTREDLYNDRLQQAKIIQDRLNAEVAQSFMQKVELAKKENPDFEAKVLKPLKVMDMDMSVVNFLNKVDNVPDVLAEIAERPSLINDIFGPYSYNPELGLKELFKLSASIKANKEAKKQPIAPPPLDQIKPSPTGKDSGKLTIQELRRLPQYRV